MQSITHKAGDTFSYYFEVDSTYLDTAATWSARAWIRDLESATVPTPVIATLTCTVTAPVVSGDDYVVLLEQDASDTEDWPRPTNPRRERRFLLDCELYSNDDPSIVQSIESVYVMVPYDPTRPA